MSSRTDPETEHMNSRGLFERRPQEVPTEKCERGKTQSQQRHNTEKTAAEVNCCLILLEVSVRQYTTVLLTLCRELWGNTVFK